MSGSEDAPELSVIVPCYNEGPTLQASLQRLVDWLSQRALSWELILIDDKSRDDSRGVADRFVADHPDLPLRTAHHEVNTGRGGAVIDGLRAARGRVAGFLDIDLEVAEHNIGPCVDAVLGGRADVATGRRLYAIGLRSLFRHVLSRGYVALVRAMVGTRLVDTESGFKWFRREAIVPLLDQVAAKDWFFDTEIMVRAERAGLVVLELPVHFERRFDKVSTVRPVHDSIVYWRNLRRFRKALRREG
jgi:glycosyltransferase involved in cell wall biosynthesis